MTPIMPIYYSAAPIAPGGRAQVRLAPGTRDREEIPAGVDICVFFRVRPGNTMTEDPQSISCGAHRRGPAEVTDYADLSSPKPLPCKEVRVHVDTIRRSV